MTKAISIQVQNDDEEILKTFNSEADLDFLKLETSSFDGQSEIVTLLVTLTPMALTFLGKVITEQIKSKRYVKVIYKGVQIQGVNEKNVAKILEEITGEEK
ncbi:hypothetical protein [Zhongshania sp.]|jgi:hypothetical protein|uniref:hypothetical protein n=1 Tax=Zhongshania sp. TaxID=1971902 RepID=UPI0039E5FEBF